MWKTKFGKCIYVSPSGFKVYQNYFYRWLTFGTSALQTVINRRAPYKPGLYYIAPLTMMARTAPGKSCLLGLGGGAVPHLLAHQQFTYPLTVVDYSEEVIQIATQFFNINHLTHLTIIKQNAVDFMQDCNEQFHHIIIDLYGAQHFPEECFNSEFFLNCKNKLTDNGFLSINIANRHEQRPLFLLLKEHFHLNTLVIPVKKCANIVIIACKNKHYLLDKLKECPELKKIKWTSSWGTIGEY